MTLLEGVRAYRPFPPQRETRAAPGLGPLPRSAGYPSSLIPLRARLSPTTSSLPKSPRAAGRARLPQPRERGISGFAFAVKRDHRVGLPPPPSPGGREAEDRLGGGREEMSLPRSAGR